MARVPFELFFIILLVTINRVLTERWITRQDLVGLQPNNEYFPTYRIPPYYYNYEARVRPNSGSTKQVTIKLKSSLKTFYKKKQTKKNNLITDHIGTYNGRASIFNRFQQNIKSLNEGEKDGNRESKNVFIIFVDSDN